MGNDTLIRRYKDPRRYYFAVQKGQAKARGISFELTFEEWWTLWEPHWDNRGKGQDDMVMCRLGDAGPYATGNVFIGTGRQNRQDAIAKMPRGLSHPRAVQVDEEAVKADYAAGEYSWNSLAAKHKTSKRTIGRILHGIHLPRKIL